MKNKGLIALLLTGGFIGLAGILLMLNGNPANMGICVACFLRDTAGALKLHTAGVVQYIRPEIIGFILGAFVLSFARGEFKTTGGSSPVIRFFIGVFVMIGALVFLGCPLRMVLRLAAGDLNAVVGLGGFIAGIAIGSFFLAKGFSLGSASRQPQIGGFVMPLIAVGLLALLMMKPEFIAFTENNADAAVAAGPGGKHAPVLMALAAAFIIGGMAQYSRMCMAGGIRDAFLIRNFNLLYGYIAVFVVALIANLATGGFALGFTKGVAADGAVIAQPIAHTQHIWNFLGMTLVGLGSALAGGCPLRQVILSGEGNTDAAITVLGLIVGGAVAHNFGLAASGKGVPANGQIAVIIGIVVLIILGFASKRQLKGAK